MASSPTSKTRRKKVRTSSVWRHFELKEVSENGKTVVSSTHFRDLFQTKARCLICRNNVYEIGFSSSTTNLLYHLKTVHAREYAELSTGEEVSTSSSTPMLVDEEVSNPTNLTNLANPEARNRSNSTPIYRQQSVRGYNISLNI